MQNFWKHYINLYKISFFFLSSSLESCSICLITVFYIIPCSSKIFIFFLDNSKWSFSSFTTLKLTDFVHGFCDSCTLLFIFWLWNSFCPKCYTGFMNLQSSPFNSVILFLYYSWSLPTFNHNFNPFLYSFFFSKVWISLLKIYRQTFTPVHSQNGARYYGIKKSVFLLHTWLFVLWEHSMGQ